MKSRSFSGVTLKLKTPYTYIASIWEIVAIVRYLYIGSNLKILDGKKRPRSYSKK